MQVKQTINTEGLKSVDRRLLNQAAESIRSAKRSFSEALALQRPDKSASGTMAGTDLANAINLELGNEQRETRNTDTLIAEQIEKYQESVTSFQAAIAKYEELGEQNPANALLNTDVKKAVMRLQGIIRKIEEKLPEYKRSTSEHTEATSSDWPAASSDWPDEWQDHSEIARFSPSDNPNDLKIFYDHGGLSDYLKRTLDNIKSISVISRGEGDETFYVFIRRDPD